MAKTEAAYHLLFEKNPSAIIAFDRETHMLLTVNEAALRVYGYSKAEFLAKSLSDIHSYPEVPALVERCARPGNDCKLNPIRVGMSKHRKKDGTIMDVDLICYPVHFNERDAIFLLITDIDHKRKNTSRGVRQFKRSQLRVPGPSCPLPTTERPGSMLEAQSPRI